jgi:diacylglycerol kinase family enzyme
MRRLTARGLRPELVTTRPAGETTTAVRDALDRQRWTRVVILGGDGTFTETARALLQRREQDVPMGVIPAGTANDQAKSFGVGIGLDALDETIDVIAKGFVQRIDAGRVTRVEADGSPGPSLVFFDSCGWGMHPDVLAQRNKDRAVVGQIPLVRELYRDEAVYAGAILNRYLASWIEPTKFDLEARLDGRLVTLSALTDLVINNTDVYAGSWVLEPRGRPDDGRFELVPFQGRRDWALKAVKDLAALPTVLREQMDAIGITTSGTLSAGTFDLTMSRPDKPRLASQVDGEEWVHGDRFRVEVLPRVLPLIVREGWVPPWRE